jgi:hypothetical protein
MWIAVHGLVFVLIVLNESSSCNVNTVQLFTQKQVFVSNVHISTSPKHTVGKSTLKELDNLELRNSKLFFRPGHFKLMRVYCTCVWTVQWICSDGYKSHVLTLYFSVTFFLSEQETFLSEQETFLSMWNFRFSRWWVWSLKSSGCSAVKSHWRWLTFQRCILSGGSTHLWNVGQLKWDYTVLHLRRL